jgi:two-component system sensor histidine kinase HydH
MSETVFDELKRYVGFGPADEAALRALHPVAQHRFQPIAEEFYRRILAHQGSREALQGGESTVGRLKVTLVAWMERLLTGPWDHEYFEVRCRIGRVHVRIALPQHYMFGAMNVLRQELTAVAEEALRSAPPELVTAILAIGKVLDLELAIMLHTYREDLLAQQSRQERLATFGQLVGSIGHELRNPLGVMETSLFILKGRTGTDERVTKHVARIGEQLGIANQIITDLLDLIRDKPLARTEVGWPALVADASGAVMRPGAVTLTATGLEELPPMQGDAGQLRQVFVNLLDNAVDAAGPSGRVEVRGEPGPAGGGRYRVVVEDSGPGIDPSVRQRLFEPLITTKVKGIGLGLALVRRIVERHGGTIQCEGEGSRLGGARFVLQFPTPLAAAVA